MTKDSLLSLVQSRGHTARIQKDEVVLEHCVFCANDRWNLELNLDRGVFCCWACKESGTLRNFLQAEFKVVQHIPVNYEAGAKEGSRALEIAPDYQDLKTVPLFDVPSAMAYLARRGVTAEDVLHHQLCLCVDDRHPMLKNRILFPLRSYWEQTMIGYVGRSYLGEKPKYWATYNTRRIVGWRRWSAVHVMVEGPIDGLAVSRAGYSAAVLLGVDSENVVEWAARVPAKEPIIILLDGAAHIQAERLLWTLQPIHANIHLFRLPEKMDPGQIAPSAMARLITHILEQAK